MSDVLAVAEHRGGALREVSHELVTAGAELAAGTGGDLHLAVVGGDVERFAADLDHDPVDTIHTIAGGGFDHRVAARAVEALVAAVDPGCVLVPNSVDGLDYAPAVAESLDLALVTDAVGLDGSDGLTVTREFHGGETRGEIEVAGGRALVAVREGRWPAAEGGDGGAAVRPFDPGIDGGVSGTASGRLGTIDTDRVDITEADVLVSVGRGIGGPDNLPLVEALADAIGATLAASAPVVDNGWLPRSRQVGQSGETVAPEIYIAVGVSGAIQHVVGIRGADTVVAINNDPDAPIFDVADYGVVGDLFDVVPALTERFA